MSLFKKEYIVSEENYMEILQRIQKITSKFFMHEIRYVDNDDKKGKRFVLKTFGIRKTWNNKRKKEVLKFFDRSSFINISEHCYKQQYELYKKGEKPTLPWFTSSDYERMKCLIHLDLGVNQAIVLCEGDKVIFHSFGWFTIAQCMFINDGKNLYHNFVPNIFRKVKNSEEIISNRRDSENAIEEMYMDDLIKDEFEHDYEEYDIDWAE